MVTLRHWPVTRLAVAPCGATGNTFCHILGADSSLFRLYPRLALGVVAFFPFLLLAVCLAPQIVPMKSVFAFLLLPQFFLFLRREGNRLHGGRDVPAHKVEINLNLLRGILTAFPGALVDKDFLDKLVEHGVRQGVEVLILINQGNEPLRRFPALLIAGDGLFPVPRFHHSGHPALWHTGHQGPHTGHPAACRGRCPHRFCKSAFPVPRPAFGRRPAACAFGNIGGLLCGLCLLNGADKFGPVIP